MAGFFHDVFISFQILIVNVGAHKMRSGIMVHALGTMESNEIEEIEFTHSDKNNASSAGNRCRGDDALGCWLPVECNRVASDHSRVFLLGCGLEKPAVQARLSEAVAELKVRKGLDSDAKLKIMVIEDGCILKKTFWKIEEVPEKEAKVGQWLNYASLTAETTYMWASRSDATSSAHEVPLNHWTPDDNFRRYKYDDPGWCVNWRSDMGVKQPSLQTHFGNAEVKSVSIFLELASDILKQTLLKPPSQITQPLPAALLQPVKEKEHKLLEALRSTDIVLVNGGSPDFIAFALRTLGSRVLEAMKEHLNTGALFWLSQGAGSMVTAADIGLTYEANPFILQYLIPRSSTGGLAMVGNCAIRPHFHMREMWDFAVPIYGAMTNLNVLGFSDNMALDCKGGVCEQFWFSEAVDEGKEHLFPRDMAVERLKLAFSLTMHSPHLLKLPASELQGRLRKTMEEHKRALEAKQWPYAQMLLYTIEHLTEILRRVT